MSESIDLAVIGGSGLYEFGGLKNVSEYAQATPFGEPSAPIVVGELEGRRVAFLARHGLGHRLNPSEVPYRANIFALKAMGAERILSISACGSLREELAPGHIVIPDQLFDHTKGRPRSFFGEGIVVHLSTPEPFCVELSELAGAAARKAGGTVHVGGTFITIEGPRFSTKAESAIFRSWGMSLIGMTTAPEVFLAREAEICYAVMAHVTDYDVWHASAASVSVALVVQTLQHNTALAQRAVRELVMALPPKRGCDCPQALAGAIITAPSSIPLAKRRELAPLIDKYIRG
jgi:5'-methylthioadenosine phosphorylase